MLIIGDVTFRQGVWTGNVGWAKTLQGDAGPQAVLARFLLASAGQSSRPKELRAFATDLSHFHASV